MTIPRRRFLHLAVGAAALPVLSTLAKAQAYPSKPLRWIIGFPAGGGADTVARIMEPWLAKHLGQPIIIENRPGASTNIAAQAVVNSPPDGYTMFWLGLSSVVNASLFKNLPFDLKRDLAPVAGVVDYPMVMVAHPAVPASNVPELIAHAKANPGKVTMASFGTGSASHLAGELFKHMAGIDMVHVPYRGGAPMTTDLIGGQVNIGFDVMVTALPQIRAGKLKAIATLGAKRFELLPDIPTVAEALPIRGQHLGRHRRAQGHPAGHHRADQQGDQCRADAAGHPRQARRRRHSAVGGEPGAVQGLHRVRVREVGQGGENRWHQAAMT